MLANCRLLCFLPKLIKSLRVGSARMSESPSWIHTTDTYGFTSTQQPNAGSHRRRKFWGKSSLTCIPRCRVRLADFRPQQSTTSWGQFASNFLCIENGSVMNKSNQKGKNNWLTWKSHIKNSFRLAPCPLLSSADHSWGNSNGLGATSRRGGEVKKRQPKIP